MVDWQKPIAMVITDYFKEISDPRVDRNKKHSLDDIFKLTILGSICGITSWEGISTFGEEKKEALQGVVSYKNGVPSHDTFERVFARINPEEFGACFIRWTKDLCDFKEELICIDGKRVRRSFDEADNKSAIHLVNAWASKNSMVLAQYKVSDKTNEITGIKELLKLLDITGCVISIDAIGCQKEIAQNIIDANGDYILAVKDNQESLKQQIQDSFNRQKPQEETTHVDKGHGRIEKRVCSIITDLKWIESLGQWKQLKTIIKIETERQMTGNVQREIRYYISSLMATAMVFNGMIRSHWGIENSLHWVLDIVFREDDDRKRKGNSAENFSLVRKIAMNVIRRDTTEKSLKKKQLKAILNDQYLLGLLEI